MAQAQDTLDVSDVKDNFLECSVCLEHFDQEERRPRLLVNCLHAFCSQCLEQLLKREGGQVTCPNCRQVQKVKGTAQSLPVDPVRNKLVDYVKFKKEKKIPCTDCPDGSHAVVRCYECQIYMCTHCKEAHRRNRPTRKHECKTLEETLSEPIRNFSSHFCKDHPDHKIEFYCGKCSSLCCVSCSIVKHKGHDLEPLEDAANSMLSSLKTQMKGVENSASLLRKEKSSIEKESSQQTQNLQITTRTINKTFQNLFGQLKLRQSKLIAEIQQRTESTVNSLKKQQEATEDSLAQMESALEYFKQMESKSDDCEVLSAGPVLVQSLQAASSVGQSRVDRDPTWAFEPKEIITLTSNAHTLGEIHPLKQKQASMTYGMHSWTKPEPEPEPEIAVSGSRKFYRSLPVPLSRKKEELSDKCPICMDPTMDPYKLDKCGHTFCGDCIRQAYKQRPACPVCGKFYGDVTGNQPKGGRMSHQTLHDIQVPGYIGSCGAIYIDYYFPGGIQQDNHPNPGMRYAGIKRTAYLPNNAEGRQVLRLLEKAFKASLTFTIGESRTTGHQGVITWNDIHHKTNLTGGPENDGYPDADYLRRVKDELAAKGITG